MNNIITGIAVLVLILIGIYFISQSKSDNSSEGFVALVDGEEMILDYPIVESFSNALSNREAEDQKKIESKKAQTYRLDSIGNTPQISAQPFVLGLYYIDTILKKGGVEYCTGRPTKDGEYVLYDSRSDYTLTSVSIADNQAYLFIDAEYIPNNLCAYMMQFKDLSTNVFKGIHLIFR